MEVIFEYLNNSGLSPEKLALFTAGFIFLIVPMMMVMSFLGSGIWGKEKEKIGKFKYVRPWMVRRMTVYKLYKRGIESGYGIKVISSEWKQGTGVSSYEITEGESAQLLRLIKSYKEKQSE